MLGKQENDLLDSQSVKEANPSLMPSVMNKTILYLVFKLWAGV